MDTMASTPRYDIVVFGASGLYGRLCAQLILRLGFPPGYKEGPSIRVALAGRRPVRLHHARQRILDEIKHGPSASDGTGVPPTLPKVPFAAADAALSVIDTPVDAENFESLLFMARQARVVVSAIRASDVKLVSNTVAACVQSGTSYTDLCALPGIIREVAERYDAPAKQAGCCIIPGCGFDYALPEVGMYHALAAYVAMHGTWPQQIEKTLQVSTGREGMVVRLAVLQGLLDSNTSSPTSNQQAPPAAAVDRSSLQQHRVAGTAAAAVEAGSSPGTPPGPPAQEEEAAQTLRGLVFGLLDLSLQLVLHALLQLLLALLRGLQALIDSRPLTWLQYQQELQAWTIPFLLGGSAEAFLHERYFHVAAAGAVPPLTAPAPAAAAAGEDGGRGFTSPHALGEGLTHSQGNGLSQAAAAPARVSAANGALDLRAGATSGGAGGGGAVASAAAAAPAGVPPPGLVCRFALPKLTLRALLWMAFGTVFMVWLAVGIQLARRYSFLRQAVLLLAPALSFGSITADDDEANRACSTYSFKLLYKLQDSGDSSRKGRTDGLPSIPGLQQQRVGWQQGGGERSGPAGSNIKRLTMVIMGPTPGRWLLVTPGCQALVALKALAVARQRNQQQQGVVGGVAEGGVCKGPRAGVLSAAALLQEDREWFLERLRVVMGVEVGIL